MAAKKEGFTDKLIRLPDELWDAVDRDADRCLRSQTKQIEAILRAYFRSDQVELREIPKPVTPKRRFVPAAISREIANANEKPDSGRDAIKKAKAKVS